MIFVFKANNFKARLYVSVLNRKAHRAKLAFSSQIIIISWEWIVWNLLAIPHKSFLANVIIEILVAFVLFISFKRLLAKFSIFNLQLKSYNI